MGKGLPVKYRIAVVGFVLFLVADGLLFYAVRQHLDAAVGAPPGDTAGTPSGTPSGAASSPGPESAGVQGLELSTSGLLARVSRGRCTADSRPLIEISADQGATFDEIALPLLEAVDDTSLGGRTATVRTVLKVRAASVDQIAIIGSDEKCRARQFVTDDGGSSWRQSEVKNLPDSEEGWYVDAAGTGVVAPARATEPGCDVLALAPVSDRNAKVTCTDGSILGTDDSGDEWVRLGDLDQVAGLTFATLRDGYAAAPGDDCEARAYETSDAGGRWEPLGCIAKDERASALVGSTGRLYGLVDGVVQISTDGGQKWELADDQAAG